MYMNNILIRCIKEGNNLPSFTEDFDDKYMLSDANIFNGVIDTVCHVTGQKKDDVLTMSRLKDKCVIPRQVTFLVLHKKYGWTLNRISNAFFGAGYPVVINHATVIHGIRTINNYIDTDNRMKKTVNSIIQKLN